MHTCVCAIFAFLLMLRIILKVPKRVRHDLLQQDYVTKAPFTEMQTRKFPSKGSVLNLLVVVISSISPACMCLHLYMCLLVHQCPFHFP